MQIQKKFWPLILGLAVSAGIFIGGRMSFTDTSDRLFTSNSKKDKLNRLIDYIDYEYVDEVNTDSIVDVTVNSILDNLDPHSTYIPKEDLQRVTENMKGDFVGIGVSFYTYNDTVTVIRHCYNNEICTCIFCPLYALKHLDVYMLTKRVYLLSIVFSL